MSDDARSFEAFAGLAPQNSPPAGAASPAGPAGDATDRLDEAYKAAGTDHPDADHFLALHPAGIEVELVQWGYIIRLRCSQDGRRVTLLGTGFAVVITGRNLQPLMPRLKARKIDWLQAYDPKRWPDHPHPAATVIERIEIIEEGGDIVPADPRPTE